MRIFLAGGTGFLGRAVGADLVEQHHQVVVLTRRPAAGRRMFGSGAEVVEGNGRREGNWMTAVDGCDAVINLAGDPLIGVKLDEETLRDARASRIELTANLVKAIGKSENRPGILLNASGVGYYGDSEVQRLPETAPPGQDWLSQLAADWESAARGAEPHGARVSFLRMGAVVHRDGGALKMMLPIFKWGLGGPIGNGGQGFPWIHRDDLCLVIRRALEDRTLAGPLNVVAPERVTSAQFARTLGSVIGRPSVLQVPEFALRMRFGRGAEPLMMGNFPSCKRLESRGYEFKYPNLVEALEAEVK